MPIPFEAEDGEVSVLPMEGPAPPALPPDVVVDIPGENRSRGEVIKERAVMKAREKGMLPPEIQGYSISITKAKIRRLHYIGRCPRIPFVDYLDAELWDLERPSPEHYHGFCRQCFGKDDPAWADIQESSASTEDCGGPAASGG